MFLFALRPFGASDIIHGSLVVLWADEMYWTERTSWYFKIKFPFHYTDRFKLFFQDPAKKPSDVYGSAHLLRLMTKISDMLSMTPILDESGIKLIENILGQFLDFLDSNLSKFFTSKNYSEASEEYLKSLEVSQWNYFLCINLFWSFSIRVLSIRCIKKKLYFFCFLLDGPSED